MSQYPWADELVEDDEAILLRALSFWKARQGLEESTSESELVVAGFACKGGTASAVTAAALAVTASWHSSVIGPSSFALGRASGRFFRPLEGTSE